MTHQLIQCQQCGHVIRPDIVLYGETLDQTTMSNALQKITHADTLIVLGSSLVVQPAAGLISHFQGEHLVIINKDTTLYDQQANLVIHNDMVSIVEELIRNG